jgi:hypothetical protein
MVLHKLEKKFAPIGEIRGKVFLDFYYGSNLNELQRLRIIRPPAKIFNHVEDSIQALT